jgi:hypothetical protein
LCEILGHDEMNDYFGRSWSSTIRVYRIQNVAVATMNIVDRRRVSQVMVQKAAPHLSPETQPRGYFKMCIAGNIVALTLPLDSMACPILSAPEIETPVTLLM